MSTENTTPVPANSGEGVAENYVSTELVKARQTMKMTVLGSAILLVVLGIYLGSMTYRVTQYAQPDVAGEVASGLIAERVNDNANAMADKFKEQIPIVMASLPDEAIKRLPDAREAIISQVETDLEKHVAASSDQLGKDLDTFLDAHKDEIKTVFEVGQNREEVKKLGPDLEKELMGYIQAPPEGGGQSIEANVNQALTMLKTMRATTNKLATSKTLTPDELKTRRAIAIISRTVNKQLKGIDAHTIIADHIGKSMPGSEG